jgi:purine-binding chemotaxis protein CheW
MSTRQFSTFLVSGRLYGIDVISVQEITKMMNATKVPLAPTFVHGLINLRGQIATAVGLRELFDLKENQQALEPMNVVCKGEGMLLSLLVDQIGDVIEVDDSNFEPTPETITQSVGRFMQGVYKIPGSLLSIIEVKKIVDVLNK